MKHWILGIAIAAAVVSGATQAAEVSQGREHRWDFDCQFSNNQSCHALASVYTRRDLTDRDRAGDVEGRWGSLNRLAVQCERGGLIYADGATLSFHRNHMVISTANGTRPRIVFDLPLGQVQTSGESGSTSATLLLPNGDEISGSCEYRRHHVQG